MSLEAFNNRDAVSRRELFNHFKKSNPALAMEYAGHKYAIYNAELLGKCLVITGVALIFLFIIALVVPPIQCSDPSAFSAIYGIICGVTIIPGMILIILGKCKKRETLNEKLTKNEFQTIFQQNLQNG